MGWGGVGVDSKRSAAAAWAAAMGRINGDRHKHAACPAWVGRSDEMDRSRRTRPSTSRTDGSATPGLRAGRDLLAPGRIASAHRRADQPFLATVMFHYISSKDSQPHATAHFGDGGEVAASCDSMRPWAMLLRRPLMLLLSLCLRKGSLFQQRGIHQRFQWHGYPSLAHFLFMEQIALVCPNEKLVSVQGRNGVCASKIAGLLFIHPPVLRMWLIQPNIPKAASLPHSTALHT
jgi:hypothetical protein